MLVFLCCITQDDVKNMNLTDNNTFVHIYYMRFYKNRIFVDMNSLVHKSNGNSNIDKLKPFNKTDLRDFFFSFHLSDLNSTSVRACRQDPRSETQVREGGSVKWLRVGPGAACATMKHVCDEILNGFSGKHEFCDMYSQLKPFNKIGKIILTTNSYFLSRQLGGHNEECLT